MGHWAETKIIDVSKGTFEAWRNGEKRIRGFECCVDETLLEKDFVNNKEVCKNVVKATGSANYPKSKRVRKLLDAVNCPKIRRDLLFVVHKYNIGEGYRYMDSGIRDGSYVSFLLFYTMMSDFGIVRKYVREEYVDPEEWEFMKDADEYAIVRQNPYMRVEYGDKNIKITMWGD